MPYAAYLRDQSKACIRLAVDSAGRRGAGALIDLAQDYASWAKSFERKPPAADEEEHEADAPWWQIFWRSRG